MPYLLAFALGLRLVLFNGSLWLDEAIEAIALQGHFGPLLSYALSDFQPPLYHYIGSLFTSLFGYSEIALRLPSLIAGVMTVYFVAKLGTLLANKKVGMISAFLTATNPLLIYYSGEGRTYAMTTLFVTASFYYFFLLLKAKKNYSSFLYFLFTTLFIWTSYLSWFVLSAQMAYVIYKKRYDILVFQIAASATLFLWLPSFLRSLQIGLSDAHMVPGWGKVVGGTSLKALALTWVKATIGRVSFDNKFLYGSIVSLIACLHISALSGSSGKKSPVLLSWIIVPIVLGSLISFWVPAYSYTRLLFIVPAYLLVLAIGLAKRHLIYTYSVVAVQLIFVIIFWLSPQFHHEDWRSLTTYLNTQSGTVVLPSLKQDAPFIYYHLSLPLMNATSALTTSKVFYVRYVEEAFDPSGQGRAHIQSLGYTMKEQRVYPGIQLDIYEK